jgi:GNAT superfamily N-acetyltransferase
VNDEVRIRLASSADAPWLAQFRFDFRLEQGQSIEEDREAFIKRCAEWMRQRLQSDGPWKCWVAEHQGVPIGNVWAQLIEKIPNPVDEPEYHLYGTNFYLLPEYRSLGIGLRLLATALDWGRSKKVHSVILWPTGKSREFYERHGFSVPMDQMELKLTKG